MVMIGVAALRKVCAGLGFVALVSCEAPPPVGPDTEEPAAVDAAPAPVARLEGEVTYTLGDGEALHRESPDTFWIPPVERRENLVAGDLVKLVFRLTDGRQTQGERMWVEVTGGDRSGYTGILDNDAYSTERIRAGLEVSFEPRHVIDIFDDPAAGAGETGEGEER